MNTKQHNRPSLLKRQFIVNPRLQWELILFFYGVSALIMVALYFAFFKIITQFDGQCNLFGIAPGEPCNHFILAQHNGLDIVFIICLVITTMISIGGGAYLSNRIAGPVYRLSVYLKQIAQGKFQKISFRKFDYFHELADVFNNEIVEKYGNKKTSNQNSDQSQKNSENFRLQRELTLFILICSIITIAILYFGIQLHRSSLLKHCSILQSGPGFGCMEFLQKQTYTINIFCIISVLLASLLSIGCGFVLAKRFIKPLDRIAKHFKLIGTGKLNKMPVQRDEYFQEIVIIINESILPKN